MDGISGRNGIPDTLNHVAIGAFKDCIRLKETMRKILYVWTLAVAILIGFAIAIGSSINQGFISVGALAASAYATIEQAGSALTQRTTLNFSGSGVTCTDDSADARTNCVVSGGGGGGVTPSQLGVANNTLTNPTSLTWTPFNTTGCALSATTNTEVIACTNSGGNNLQGQTTPVNGSNPYTVVMAETSNVLPFNFAQCGIAITDGTNFEVMRYPKDGGDLDIFTWIGTGSPDTGLFTLGAQALQPTPYIFLKVQETSSNRLWSISGDGTNFSLLFTEAAKAFLTTTAAGYFCLNNNGVSGTVAGITVASFLTTAP
jgi:hypothetical protein